jgi:hypothetical protein
MGLLCPWHTAGCCGFFWGPGAMTGAGGAAKSRPLCAAPLPLSRPGTLGKRDTKLLTRPSFRRFADPKWRAEQRAAAAAVFHQAVCPVIAQAPTSEMVRISGISGSLLRAQGNMHPLHRPSPTPRSVGGWPSPPAALPPSARPPAPPPPGPVARAHPPIHATAALFAEPCTAPIPGDPVCLLLQSNLKSPPPRRSQKPNYTTWRSQVTLRRARGPGGENSLGRARLGRRGRARARAPLARRVGSRQHRAAPAS